MCIYGIELLADNIAECRANLLEILAEHLGLDDSDELHRAASYVLSQNLVHGDALTMRTHETSRSPLPNGRIWAKASSSGATSALTRSRCRRPSARRARCSPIWASTRSSRPPRLAADDSERAGWRR